MAYSNLFDFGLGAIDTPKINTPPIADTSTNQSIQGYIPPNRVGLAGGASKKADYLQQQAEEKKIAAQQAEIDQKTQEFKSIQPVTTEPDITKQAKEIADRYKTGLANLKPTQETQVAQTYDTLRQKEIAQARADAEIAQRRTAQQAAAQGVTPETVAGLSELSRMEAQAQGAQQVGTLAEKEAIDTLNAKKADLDEQYNRQLTDEAELMKMIQTYGGDPTIRKTLIEQLKAMNPVSIPAQMLVANPDTWQSVWDDQEFERQAVKTQKGNQFILDNGISAWDADELTNNFDGWVKSIGGLDTWKDYKPTASEVEDYQTITGKTWDGNPATIGAWKAYYNAVDKAYGPEDLAEFTAFSANMDLNDPIQRKFFNEHRASILSALKDTTSTVSGITVTWDTDVRNGAIAPLNYTVDGQEITSANQKEVFSDPSHINSAAVFRELNAKLKELKIDPIKWTDFGKLLVENREIYDSFMDGTLTNSEISKIATTLMESPTISKEVEAKQGPVTEQTDNLLKQPYSEANRQKVLKNLANMGNATLNKWITTADPEMLDKYNIRSTPMDEDTSFGANTHPEWLIQQNIKSGVTVMFSQGKAYVFENVHNSLDENDFSANGFRSQVYARPINPDGTLGEPVIIRDEKSGNWDTNNTMRIYTEKGQIS